MMEKWESMTQSINQFIFSVPGMLEKSQKPDTRLF